MSGNLLHSPADVVRWALINAGLGTDPANSGSWPIHQSIERDTPDNCITTYNTTGLREGRIMVNGQTQIRYGIQVRVRATDEVTGFTKAQAIWQAFDGFDKETIVIAASSEVAEGTYLLQAVHNANLIYAGQESTSSARTVHTLNCLASMRMTS